MLLRAALALLHGHARKVVVTAVLKHDCAEVCMAALAAAACVLMMHSVI